MEKSGPSPYELRLVEYAIIDRLKEGSMIPSDFIRIMGNEPEAERRRVILNTFNIHATAGFKERVKKVGEALMILKEFDIPE